MEDLKGYQIQKEAVFENGPFARAMMNSVSLTASQALEMQVLFPIWGEKDAEFGKEVEIGFRLRVVEGESDTLFEVIQKHKLQADWKPGIETASLYKIVKAEHAGTLDDPKMCIRDRSKEFTVRATTEDGVKIIFPRAGVSASGKANEKAIARHRRTGAGTRSISAATSGWSLTVAPAPATA